MFVREGGEGGVRAIALSLSLSIAYVLSFKTGRDASGAGEGEREKEDVRIFTNVVYNVPSALKKLEMVSMCQGICCAIDGIVNACTAYRRK